METDGTTPSEGGNGNDWHRKQQRRERWRHRRDWCQQRMHRTRSPFRQPKQERPMWQEPVRGALYAAGSGVIALAFAWFQHWL